MSRRPPFDVRVVTSTGRDVHIGHLAVDEPDYVKAVPGGWLNARVSIPASAGRDLLYDLQPFDKMFIYDGRHCGLLFEGELAEPAMTVSRPGDTWDLVAVGGSAQANDEEAPYIAVDRSIERFQQRALGYNQAGQSDITDDGSSAPPAPAVRGFAPRGTVCVVGWLTGRGYWAVREAGHKLARVAVTITGGRNTSGWRCKVRTRSGGGTFDDAVDFNMVTSTNAFSRVVKDSGGVGDFTYGRDVVELLIERATTDETPANDTTFGLFTGVVVRALLLNADGTEKRTGYTADTVTAAEIFTDLLGRRLTGWDGARAVIPATTVPIEQFAYPEPAVTAKLLDDACELEGCWWAVHGSALAAWDPASTGKPVPGLYRWPKTIRYDIDPDDGDFPPAGLDTWNRVQVRYRDHLGRTRTVIRTTTAAALPTGRNRTKAIDLGDETGSATVATTVGDAFLAANAQPPNAGTVLVQQRAWDRLEARWVEPHEIEPGYLALVRSVFPRVDSLNATDRDAATVFRVTGVRWAPSGATLQLDSRPRDLESLVADISRGVARGRRR